MVSCALAAKTVTSVFVLQRLAAVIFLFAPVIASLRIGNKHSNIFATTKTTRRKKRKKKNEDKGNVDLRVYGCVHVRKCTLSSNSLKFGLSKKYFRSTKHIRPAHYTSCHTFVDHTKQASLSKKTFFKGQRFQ